MSTEGPYGLDKQPALSALLHTATMCAAEKGNSKLGEQDLVQAVVESGTDEACRMLGSRAVVEDLLETSLGDLSEIHVVEIPEKGDRIVKAPAYLKEVVETVIEWKPRGASAVDLLGALAIGSPEFLEWMTARLGAERAGKAADGLAERLVGPSLLARWLAVRQRVGNGDGQGKETRDGT